MVKENTMITFAQIKQLFAFETQGKYCVEILFSVHESKKFDCCWMGKLHRKKIGHDVYWFGLTSDGKNAFDYPTFEEFSNAKVFDGKSLVEIWDTVTVEEIDVQANEMTETIVANLARERGIDEELKASDALKWVAEMNNIKASAEEIVLREVVYV